MAGLICGLLATTASAEDMPSAVGRISYSDVPQPGSAICSGVLVAPDLVLTAGHCVRGAAGDPAALRFDAGWSDGTPTRRRGRAVILASRALPTGLAGLSQDVALLVLETGFLPEEAQPLPLAAAPAADPATDFVLHAFARTTPDQPMPAAPCALRATVPGPDVRGGLLGLDCPVVSGNSGAPLLQADADGWHIAALMVAQGKGQIRAWAVQIPETLLAQIRLWGE